MVEKLYNFSKKEDLKPLEQTKDGSETTKLMTSAGLGAGIGIIYQLAKLRHKLKMKYYREKKIAMEQGMPIPPPPDLSKGALMAILKGAAIGGAGGAIVGKTPVIGKIANDTAASIDAGARKLLTGSKFTVTDNSDKDTKKKFFSEVLEYYPNNFSYIDNDLLSVIDFSECNDLPNITGDDVRYMFFSMAENFSKSKGKKDTNELIKENPKNEMDRKTLGRAGNALPVIGALIGGGGATWAAYERALAEYNDRAREAYERGEPPPPKPSILEFVGAGAKGAIVGGVGGYAASRLGPGQAINKAVSNKLDDYGLVNEKKANRAIKSHEKYEKERAKAMKKKYKSFSSLVDEVYSNTFSKPIIEKTFSADRYNKLSDLIDGMKAYYFDADIEVDDANDIELNGQQVYDQPIGPENTSEDDLNRDGKIDMTERLKAELGDIKEKADANPVLGNKYVRLGTGAAALGGLGYTGYKIYDKKRREINFSKEDMKRYFLGR